MQMLELAVKEGIGRKWRQTIGFGEETGQEKKGKPGLEAALVFFFLYMLLLKNEDSWIWEGSMWPLVVRTWQSSHIHFLQVLGLQDTDGEFASGGDVTQRDANVTQLLRLWTK